MKISLLVAIIIFFGSAFSQDIIEFCSSANWPPFESLNKESNKVEGISVDYLTKTFEKMNKKFKVVSRPWERCLYENENGKIQGVFSVSKKEDREKYLIYPDEPLYEVSYVVAVLSNPEKAWDLALWDEKKDINLLPKPIASPQGYSVTEELKKINPSIIDDTAISDRINFDKLVNGRAGCIVISPQVLNSFIKQDKLEGKIKELSPSYTEPKKYYIAVSKAYKGSEENARALADEISKALKEIKSKI